MKIISSFLLFYSTATYSYEFELNSSKQQTQVIELFTSEGCSSCPPADRWLSTLKQSKDLWSHFIPIAFHVDYWDYIGWKDKLALANNSHRQRIHKIFENIPSVYTPGLLKAGKEWRTWRFTNASNIIQTPVIAGKLSIKINDNKLTSTFLPTHALEKYKLNIALLGMNINNKIRAGENHGKSLKHDFVILKHRNFVSQLPTWDLNLDPDFFNHHYQDLAFVVWVEAENNPAPIQAVGKFL